MNHSLSFACIGGDLRQVRVVNNLAKDGYHIQVFGIYHPSFKDYENIHHMPCLTECIENTQVVILPLPYRQGSTLFAPLSKEPIEVSAVLESMKSPQLLLAGFADADLYALSQLYKIELFDYLAREELSVRNVIPTVEGALQIAMKETPFTLHQSNCLVLGHGRIGSYLAHALKHLGAYVSVAARKQKDFAWIENYGMTPLAFSDLSENICQFDIVFNTVPTEILRQKELESLSPHALIIDLASAPGGVDRETAKALGKRVIWALSLPGKVAPQTSGDIIKETIIHILEEREVASCNH